MSFEVYLPKLLGWIAICNDYICDKYFHFETLYAYDIVVNIKVNTSLK